MSKTKPSVDRYATEASVTDEHASRVSASAKAPLLSPEALAALDAGRKINAIKIVRKQQGIGLKEAKQVVDAYILLHPELQSSEQGAGRLFIIAVGVVLIFVVYKYFIG